jgi:hypothetical protein
LTQVKSLICFKEKNLIEFKTYKDKSENILNGVNIQIENMDRSQKNYITKMLEENESYLKRENENILNKINDMRMENNKYCYLLKQNSNELIEEKNNFQQMKIFLENKIEENLKKSKDINKNTLDSFEVIKGEYNDIKNKFKGLSEFIKDVRFRKNLGVDVGRKEIKKLTKKITHSTDKKNKIDNKNNNNKINKNHDNDNHNENEGNNNNNIFKTGFLNNINFDKNKNNEIKDNDNNNDKFICKDKDIFNEKNKKYINVINNDNYSLNGNNRHKKRLINFGIIGKDDIIEQNSEEDICNDNFDNKNLKKKEKEKNTLNINNLKGFNNSNDNYKINNKNKNQKRTYNYDDNIYYRKSVNNLEDKNKNYIKIKSKSNDNLNNYCNYANANSNIYFNSNNNYSNNENNTLNLNNNNINNNINSIILKKSKANDSNSLSIGKNYSEKGSKEFNNNTNTNLKTIKIKSNNDINFKLKLPTIKLNKNLKSKTFNNNFPSNKLFSLNIIEENYDNNNTNTNNNDDNYNNIIKPKLSQNYFSDKIITLKKLYSNTNTNKKSYSNSSINDLRKKQKM